MIISENITKVKRKISSLINKSDNYLSKPENKFVQEMVIGMLLSGSCNLSEISRKLKEKISIKDTLKRLVRMSEHGSSILEIANKISLSESKSKINDDTVLALDTGDINHQYSKSMENIALVFDGSAKKTAKGYWLNQVSGYNAYNQETFPLLLNLYSTKAQGFKSENTESIHLIEKVVKECGTKGLWVMDRGYDRNEIYKYLFRKGLDFMIRLRGDRNVLFRNKSVNSKKLCLSINRRIKFNSCSRFGSKKIIFQDREATLISYKDSRNKGVVMFMTNGWIKSSKELKRRIRGYFKRWGVEESYRFEKQGFGIEKAMVRKYSKIKCLIGITILSWLVLIKINESPKLREKVLSNAKHEKIKKKNKPKFIYYRLLKGVQNLFEGVKEIFRFRLKKSEKSKIIEELNIRNSLFPELLLQLEGFTV